jgi:hypothetical protein
MHRKMTTLFEHLKKFDSISMRLQRDERDMAKFRLLFDALVAENSVMADHLNPFAVEGHNIRPFRHFATHGVKAPPSKGAFCALLHEFNREPTAFFKKS